MRLEVRGVVVRFGQVIALDGVDLAVETGQCVGLLGPNGAGKTTLLNVLAGAIVPEAGEAWVDGRRLDRLPPWRRVELGVARTFQRCELVGELTVLENLLCGAYRRLGIADELMGRGQTRAVRQRAREVAEMLGLDPELLDRPAGTLPYGTQRRVEIGRALMAEPRFLLLDEPVAGMDPAESLEIGRLVRIWVAETGGGALLVEHDVDLVAEVCDFCFVLDFGRLIASGPPKQVLRERAVVEAYLGAEEVA